MGHKKGQSEGTGKIRILEKRSILNACKYMKVISSEALHFVINGPSGEVLHTWTFWLKKTFVWLYVG